MMAHVFMLQHLGFQKIKRNLSLLIKELSKHENILALQIQRKLEFPPENIKMLYN